LQEEIATEKATKTDAQIIAEHIDRVLFARMNFNVQRQKDAARFKFPIAVRYSCPMCGWSWTVETEPWSFVITSNACPECGDEGWDF
jgi:predicted RNA-binding Zn-ribbon protein involved in translation (DUF1610 family)